MSGAGESMGGGSGGLKDKIKLITGDTGDLEAGIKLEVWVDRATTQLLLAVASMQPQNQRYKGQASTFLDFQNSALYPSTILTDYVFIESENDLYRLASIGAGGVKNWTSLKQDLKSRIDILEAFIDDESDVDGIVNKVAEVLKVFENYPEGVNILQEFNDIKASILLKADTLTTYAKTDVDALLDAKQDKIYDITTTESNIFGITDITKAGQIALATDTKKIYKAINLNNTLIWSLYYGSESKFSYVLNANEIKTISLVFPTDFKSNYKITIKAISGSIKNTLTLDLFYDINDNAGIILDNSLFTDSNDIALIDIYDSSTSIQANKIAMQLQNLVNNSVNIFIYIN